MGLTSHIIQGISEELSTTQYHLIVTPYNHMNDPMDPLRYIVETNSADGIIFSRTEPVDPRVKFLAERGMPFVTHGRTNMGVEHAYHDFDNERFGYDAVGILARRRRKRISLLGPPVNLTYARHMSAGFNSAAAEFGISVTPFDSVNVDDAVSRIVAAVSDLMASKIRPDGIVCGSAGAAIGAAAGIELAGLTIGQDVDIVSKQSSVDLLKWFRPEIHVINEDFREAGSGLARKMMERIAGRSVHELQTVIY
jgi:LacI family transcriptional regulator